MPRSTAMSRVSPALVAAAVVFSTAAALTASARSTAKPTTDAAQANRDNRDAAERAGWIAVDAVPSSPSRTVKAPAQSAVASHRDHAVPTPTPRSTLAPDRSESIIVPVLATATPEQSRAQVVRATIATPDVRHAESTMPQSALTTSPTVTSPSMPAPARRFIDVDLAIQLARIDTRAGVTTVLHTVNGDSIAVSAQEILKLRILPRSQGATRVP